MTQEEGADQQPYREEEQYVWLMDAMEAWPDEKKKAFIKTGKKEGEDSRVLYLNLPVVVSGEGESERKLRVLAITRDGSYEIRGEEHAMFPGPEYKRWGVFLTLDYLREGKPDMGDSGYFVEGNERFFILHANDGLGQVKNKVKVEERNDNGVQARPFTGDIHDQINQAVMRLPQISTTT